ncbi:glutamate decarboxylase [Schizosaccharomyces japonicus yFS275]|uniref:Glutamate decarboxylase n=1 Tax=Schizosaccharomyces japonicus (strain yFS275 / FY16936) TaxID=402676 RepID=B6JX11_SCHJY|nr:glutamate decarboxylase [Schizosaccharomyces japonicus yFS275]EEB05912.1 glutamate decarboxylase [Schizosaccharomyces japonicus yFS275]
MLFKQVTEADVRQVLNDRISKLRETQHPSVPKALAIPYESAYDRDFEIPKFQLPDEGIQARDAYRLIHDELDFDGQPTLNLATFVHTFMEDEVTQLMMENVNKNLADADEYPALVDIHARCVSMIANLWNAPLINGKSTGFGTSTIGSSEAVILGGLVMKKQWQLKRKSKGLDFSKPNIIMGANAQVALEKFARYFDVEARMVPVNEKSRHCLDITQLESQVDENTIGVFVILGSTYTGNFENVKEVSKKLDEIQAKTGLDVPIHVDAASGGMIAPFAFPDLEWDFRVPRVKSINTSGHKYGMVYPGLGFIIWRSREWVPDDLIFKLHYLGGTELTYTLNFSRPGSQVIAQYYNFIRYGFQGYKQVAETDLFHARLLSFCLEASGYFRCLSDIHRQRGSYAFDPSKAVYSKATEFYNAGLPVVSFCLIDDYKKEHPYVRQDDISRLLRMKGWIVPNYPLPPNENKTEILRVVVRNTLSRNLVDRLVHDILDAVEYLEKEADEKAFIHPQISVSAEKQHSSLGAIGGNNDPEHRSGAKGAFSYTC